MKIIAANKKATYDYNISLKLDAGIVLTGSEVKSLRNISPSIKESYIEEKDAELWLKNCFIKKYASSSDKDNDPTRSRKLLVNRKELNKILGSIRRDGFSVVPITMFFSTKGFVKLSIGLGKGKKKYDKREDQKSKDWNRNKQRLLKNN
ncbi:MAG: SsrA-binding protein SmpB [Pelagibacteraceae bacterium]|nr:SsrA-binding protein SmpB [Pelagibacteraceae bacterium]MBT3902897.1 SsrA-binding protein SmpB [Pelagibacteraceae bacterium]MBT4645188.1 SsrA-binding protein SmpB [Pelagibacteraceae bacterium]MBT4952116.1 SsrA-binding protein SmpB [Pelagibacteraceae bacterium]MBT5213415.1 SsrA-binding protein SmpB [Pelagibacteraceae bacterium]